MKGGHFWGTLFEKLPKNGLFFCFSKQLIDSHLLPEHKRIAHFRRVWIPARNYSHSIVALCCNRL